MVLICHNETDHERSCHDAINWFLSPTVQPVTRLLCVQRDTSHPFDAHITNQQLQGGHSHVSQWTIISSIFLFPLSWFKKTPLSFTQPDSFPAGVSSENDDFFVAQFGLDTSVRWDFNQMKLTHRPGFLMKIFHTCKLTHLLPADHSQWLFPKAFLTANTSAQVFGNFTTNKGTKTSRSKCNIEFDKYLPKKPAPSPCGSHPTEIILLACLSNLESLNERKSSVSFGGN